MGESLKSHHHKGIISKMLDVSGIGKDNKASIIFHVDQAILLAKREEKNAINKRLIEHFLISNNVDSLGVDLYV